jgi:hypothetical protein
MRSGRSPLRITLAIAYKSQALDLSGYRGALVASERLVNNLNSARRVEVPEFEYEERND